MDENNITIYNFELINVILVSEAHPESFYMKCGFVYIMANTRPTLYVGVTNNLKRRVLEHKNHLVKGFTLKYNIFKLVYYEFCDSIEHAIIREKQIKDMNRNEKLKMISYFNPNFEDLFAKI